MSDALAWAIVVVVVVALVASVAVFFLLVLPRERRAFEVAVNDLAHRMDAMVRELHATVDSSHDDDRRARILGELAGTIDLDEVLARVLEAAGAMRGVDAALVTITGTPGEKPIVATV